MKIKLPKCRLRYSNARVFGVGCFVILMIAVTSCSRNSGSEAKGRRAAGPAPVTVAVVANRDVPVEIQGIGTAQAYSLVSVRSQVTGTIQKVHFQEGQEVSAGDLLFTIDPRPFEAALNQAQANLKRDEAQLLNARVNFERTSNLFVSKIASQSDYDTAEATYKSAQGTVLADSAVITNAEVNLSYTSIRAPIKARRECAEAVMIQWGKRARQCAASRMRACGRCTPAAPHCAASCGSSAISNVASPDSCCARTRRRSAARARTTATLPGGKARAARAQSALRSSVIKTSGMSGLSRPALRSSALRPE